MKWLPDNLKGILAFIIVVSSFVYFFIMSFLEKTTDPQVIIAIVAICQNVVNYYFGSSQGANRKDQIIAEMNANPVAGTNSGDIIVNPKKEENDKAD